MSEKKGLLIVVSGFSGAGKGTLVKALTREDADFALSVSVTTRAPRPNEAHGRDYFFITDAEFDRLIETDGLLEYAEYCTHRYGTPRSFVEERIAAGCSVMLEIEVQGALQIRKKFPEALLLFVLPPSMRELQRRLEGRGTESAEAIRGRLRRAKEESAFIGAYDYIVVNDDLEETAARVREIVRAASWTPARQKAFIDKVHREFSQIT